MKSNVFWNLDQSVHRIYCSCM